MTTRRRVLLLSPLAVALALVVGGLSSCRASSHAVQPSPVGAPRANADFEALVEQPGPIEVETINSADWKIDRSGLINLDHPKAREAGLEDGLEDIQIYFHVIRHPTKGTFIIDTGVERALRDDPDASAASGLLRSFMKTKHMKIHVPLADWIEQRRQTGETLRGVFLTHLHYDHVAGMADVPRDARVFTGPGESTARGFMNAFTIGTTDRALAGLPAVSEWTFDAKVSGEGPFEAVVDVFGDGSFWALSVPGHTPGTTAYLARTPSGPVLFVGDASHTRWGWENDVEPGTFTHDAPRSVESFQRLRRFAAAHPKVEVRLGHQR